MYLFVLVFFFAIPKSVLSLACDPLQLFLFAWKFPSLMSSFLLQRIKLLLFFYTLWPAVTSSNAGWLAGWHYLSAFHFKMNYEYSFTCKPYWRWTKTGLLSSMRKKNLTRHINRAYGSTWRMVIPRGIGHMWMCLKKRTNIMFRNDALVVGKGRGMRIKPTEISF